MAETLGTAELILTADATRLQAGLNQAQRQAQQTGRAIEQSFTQSGRKIETAANGLQYFVDAQGRARKENGQFVTAAERAAAGIQNLGSQAKEGAASFLGLETSIQGLVGGFAALGAVRFGFAQIKAADDAGAAVRTLGVDSEELRSKLSDLSSELDSNVSTVDLLKASYDVASSGFADAASATDILRASAAGAKGGFADINEVAKATTAVLNAYGMSSAEAARVVDGFVQAQADGVLTVKQYADNIGEIVSVASAAGITIEELNAAIATATLKGVQVNQAFTGFRQVISSILKPSKEATDLATSLGIDYSLAGLQAKGFAGFLKDVAVKTGAAADKTAVLLGSVEAQAALQPLLNDKLAKYNELLENQAKKAGTAAKAAKTSTETISGGLAKIQNKLSNIAITVDKDVNGELKTTLQIVGALVTAFEKLAIARGKGTPGTSAGAQGLQGLGSVGNAFSPFATGGPVGGIAKQLLQIPFIRNLLGGPAQRGIEGLRELFGGGATPAAAPQQGPPVPPELQGSPFAIPQAEREAFWSRVKQLREAELAASKEQAKVEATLTTTNRDRLRVMEATRDLQGDALSFAQDQLAIDQARRDAARAALAYETESDPKRQAQAANALVEAAAGVGIAIEEATRRAADRLKEARDALKAAAEALTTSRQGFAGAVGQAFAIATNEQRLRARQINEERIRAAERAGAFDPARVATRYGLEQTGAGLNLQSLTFRQLERLAGEVGTLADAESNLQTAMRDNTLALNQLAKRKWEVQVNVRNNANGTTAVDYVNNLR